MESERGEGPEVYRQVGAEGRRREEGGGTQEHGAEDGAKGNGEEIRREEGGPEDRIEGCPEDWKEGRSPGPRAQGCRPQGGTGSQGSIGSQSARTQTGARAQGGAEDRRNPEPAGTQRPGSPGGGRSEHHRSHGTRQRGDGSRDPAAGQRGVSATCR